MKRQTIAELLDTDSGTPAEIAASLDDLRLINRSFGGLTTTERMIERVAKLSGRRSFTMMEVAAGSGETPRAIQHRLRKKQIELKIILLDRAWSHLSHGNTNGHASASLGAVVGDALALPFRSSSFDLVSCNLFTHHLSASQIVQFVNEGLRICRMAVLINDLVRHRLHLAAVYAGMPMFRSRITHHDGPASVRQAYTVKEMESILQESHAASLEIRKSYLFRMGAIAWKVAAQ